MVRTFERRVTGISAVAVALTACLVSMQPAQAANYSWSVPGYGVWNTTSNNWGFMNGTAVATPWDPTNGPGTQANFYTSGVTADATGQNLYAYAIDFQAGVSGCLITGGTIDTGYYTASAGAIEMNLAGAGTNTIASTLALQNNAEYITTVNTGANPGAMLNLTGLVTSSGTVYMNPGGNTPNSNSGSVIALGGSADSFNLLEETNGNHGTMYIPSGGSVSANYFYVLNYAANSINGNLSCGTAYLNGGTAGPTIFTGSGTITVNNWISNHLGTINLGSTSSMPTGLPQTFTGALNVSGSFVMGVNNVGIPGGSNGNGSLVNQFGGAVTLSSVTPDSIAMGYMYTPGQDSRTTYMLGAGTLSIPSVPFELGRQTLGQTVGSSVSTFSQTGGLANVYGLWMGQTQGLGAQNGNCAISITGGTLNLGADGIQSNGTGTKTVTFGSATIGATAPWSTPAGQAILLSGNTIFNTSGGNITLAGALSNSGAQTGGLTATGGGTLLLDTANTYTGATTVSSGTLQLGDGVTNAGSVTSNISTSGGAVVLFAVPPTGSVTYSNSMTGAGRLVVAGGSLQLGDGFSNNGTVTIPVTNSGALVFSNPQPQTVAAAISGSGAVFVNGPQSLTLAASNNFSGGVTLASGGILNVNNNNALGSGTLTINGGVIDSTTSGVTLGNVPQNWNADFTFNGTNNLNLGTGAVLISNSSRTITLNGGVLTVGGPISDGGNAYSLSVTSPSGSGVLALGGASTYSGGTNVYSGGLVVNGQVGGALMVASGGSLGGNGLVSGAVTLGNSATLSPGPSLFLSSVGTLTASSLSIGSSDTIAFDLSSSIGGAGNDKVTVTGNLSLPPDLATIVVNATGGSLAQNVPYTLFNYGGALSVTGSPLVYSGPLGARQTASFGYGTGSNSAITLTINGNFRNLIWTGTGSNTDTWDQNNTSNLCWTSAQSPTGDYFAALDNVRFDATSTPGNQTVTLDYNNGSPLTPSSVLVTGAKNYTFQGSGQIGGATALTVAGPGSLTIQVANNSYTGGTNIQGGSIILATYNPLPTTGTVTFGAVGSAGTLDLAGQSQTVGGLAVASGAAASAQTITDSTGLGTLTYAGTGSSTFGGTLKDASPTGQLALEVSSGLLVLSGSNNTFTGGTNVNGGTLQVGVTNALPTGANGNITLTNFNGVGTLDLGGHSQTTAGTLSLQGGIVQNGTFTSTVAAFDAQAGTVAANLAGPVALNKTSGSLFVIGSPGSSYTGGTNISGGILQLGSANALPTGGAITVSAGGTFDLGGVSQSTSGVVSFQGGTVQNGTLTSTTTAFDGQSGDITANLAGSVGLNKTTAGQLTLSGTDTYTGNTVVSNGILQLGSANGVPGGLGTGNVILNGGASTAGTIDLNGNTSDFGGLSGAAGAVPGLITNFGGSGGTLTVGDNNSTSTFSGTLADGNSPLGFAKTGTGTLTLNGSNNYSGDTTVAQGILVATNTAALGNPTSSTILTVNTGAELQLPAAVINVGNVSVGGSGVTGFGAIKGGTLNVTGSTINVIASGGTTTISSPTLLNPSSGSTLINCPAGNTMLLSGPMNATGNVFTSSAGNYVFGGGAMTISGTLQEGIYPQGQNSILTVLPGTTLNCGYFCNPTYVTLTIGGTMNATSVYTSNTANPIYINGNGVFNVTNFLGSGGGVTDFSNGVLNITGSADIGPIGPQILSNTPRYGCTLQQDSGTVNITGTGDGFTIGSEAATGNGSYTQDGGVLNVPNQYVELCYATGGTASTSYFQVLGSPSSLATANVYGISFGQTVNNGVQNGWGTVKLGDAGSLLVIGSGGIVSATSGSAQVILGTGTGGGTLASSAPWSTTVPLTLGGALAINTNIDASAGTISLNGPIGGAGGLNAIGSGVLVLGGSNTYNGTTTLASGVLALAHSAALGGGGAVTFAGGTLQFTASSAEDISAHIVNSSRPVALDTNGQSVAFASGLSPSNTAGLTKLGAGLLAMGGSSGYGGPTVISGGTLQLGNFTPTVANGNFSAPGLASNSYIYFSNMSATQQAALVWSGGVLINNSTAWGYVMPYPGGNQAISLQSAATLTEPLYFPAAGTYTISWSDAGRPGLNVNPYYLILDGGTANTPGAVFVESTTASWTSESTSFTIASPGEHTIGFQAEGGAGDTDVALDSIGLSGGPGGIGQLPSTTALQITAAGAVFDLNGGSQTVGSLAGVAGAIVTNNGGAPSTLTVNQSVTTTFSGTISDGSKPTSLALTGAGTLYLTGTNTYSGGTYVEGSSTLIVGNNDAIDGNNRGNNNLYVGSAAGLAMFGGAIPAGDSSPAGVPAAALAVTPVPEPGTLALGAAAGAAMLVMLRRRRRA